MRATLARDGAPRGANEALRRAIVRTLAYADVFDYPLDRGQIHRYLIGERATPEEVDRALDHDSEPREIVERTGDLFHLRGRTAIVADRRRREAASAELWRAARAYGRWVARLPLVRFAAVTGALAMNNAERDADIDLFILTRPGRLWLCRLLVLAIVRLAALRGHRLCPNFLLSTDRLLLDERNLFTAHEVAQMVPLRSTDWHASFLSANAWISEHLPSADLVVDRARAEPPLARLLGAFLATPFFAPLERWEMRRKIRRLRARAEREGGSLAFSADECRGHFAAHDVRVLAAYSDRVAVTLGPSA